jgi:hypothetical protein
MKVWNKLLVHLACSGLIFSSFQAAAWPVGGQQPPAEESSSTTEQARLETLPDSPGATRAQTQDQSSPNNPPRESQVQPSSPVQEQPAASQPQSQSSQTPSSSPQRPVGTAAAETSNPGGVAASQPAGVAIAPAKQRRVRTIVLRVGAIVGAGVAVGTVVALTQATPSKPPGAH